MVSVSPRTSPPCANLLHRQPCEGGRIAPPALPCTSRGAVGASWLVWQLLLSLNVALGLKCQLAARSCLAKSMQAASTEEDVGPARLWRSAAFRHRVRAALKAGDLSPLNFASPGVPVFFYFLKLFPPCLCATLLPRLPALSFRLAEGSAPASGKEKLGASAVCGVGAARGAPSSICPSEEPSCAATSPTSPAAKALNGAEQVTRCSPSCSFPSCGKRKGNSFA